MGYSDITVLLQTLYKKIGLVGFHGYNFINFGEPEAEERFKEFESVFINKKLNRFIKGEKKIIREGNTRGKTIGTNFGSMMYLVGTNYLPDVEDKILFLESLRSSPNECQRRFAHLKQLGIFDKIKGIVIGYNYDLQKDGNIYPQMEEINFLK